MHDFPKGSCCTDACCSSAECQCITFQRMRATMTPSERWRCSSSVKASRFLRSLRRRSWRSFSFSSAACFSRCLHAPQSSQEWRNGAFTTFISAACTLQVQAPGCSNMAGASHGALIDRPFLRGLLLLH